MATTKLTSPDLFNLESLNTALQLPSGTTAQRPTSPSTGEWRYNTTTNLIEFYDGGAWRDLQSEEIPPIPSEHFNTVLWTGNGTGQSITGVGFAPDFVWLKNRDQNSYGHRIFDTSRGALKKISPSGTGAESTDAGSVTSFDSDGFTLGNDNYVNNSGDDFVGWTIKANGGTTTSNSEGSRSSTVQANTKAGFSIVEWTGDGNTATIGHGLNAAPELILVKTRTDVSDWPVYCSGLTSAAYRLVLNSTAAESTTNDEWNSTAPTSTVFSVGNGGNVSGSGRDFVGYCFHSVAGYSKISTYTGNGSTNGPIVNTGFEPAFIMIKNASAIYEWTIYDNKRSTSNPRDNVLYPNNNDAENTGETGDIDFLTNGFQIKATDGSINQNGGNIIYLAFASDPSTAPVLANSFNTTLYTGTSSTHAITGLGFQPDLVWIKDRGNAEQHVLNDSLRGATKDLSSNSTAAEATRATGFISFDSNGFTLGTDGGGLVNDSSRGPYVAWAWKANTLPAINTDGSTTAIVSANVAAGFSIVHLENHAGTYTVGHGLDGVPDLIITRVYDGVSNWLVYNSPIGARNYMLLNTTAGNAAATPGYEYDSVTATTFTNLISASTLSYIHYCFKSVTGYSKIGSYSGSSSDVTVTTGFQPDYVLIKRTSGTSRWIVLDVARNNFTSYLDPQDSLAEQTDSEIYISVTSTTIVVPAGPPANVAINKNGESYIYMAYKQNYSIPETQMAYLSVAGGGGASRDSGGGGGAGGLRTSWGYSSGGGSSLESNITLAAGTYTITVGSGGNITNGNTSSIAGPSLTTISCVGGGVGSGADNSYSAGTGGSGGGGAGGSYSNSGGSGTANQGFAGGSSAGSGTGLTCFPGAGGGGASAGGGGVSRNDDTNAGNGGAGLSVDITGTGVFYAGGGGGAINNCAGATAGSGGSGGGGTGSIGGGTSDATDGATNTGGGAGGGSGVGTQGLGGSGVVILRLKTSVYTGTTTGSPTVTTDGSDTILTYTGSGTYVHS